MTKQESDELRRREVAALERIAVKQPPPRRTLADLILGPKQEDDLRGGRTFMGLMGGL